MSYSPTFARMTEAVSDLRDLVDQYEEEIDRLSKAVVKLEKENATFKSRLDRFTGLRSPFPSGHSSGPF
jgi:predicted RNase H-like nuclease (RuvC/YqgF family)